MFSLPKLSLLLCSTTTLLLPAVLSQVLPTTPDGSSSYDVGSTITAVWTPDTTGSWTNVTIKLMSGDNYDMIEVVEIADGIDGVTMSSYAFDAPDVTPNSAIYFLQFTTAGNATAYEWTTRFTIASANGSTTSPANSTQPGGADIPWGVGTLVGSYATNSGTSSSSDSTVNADTTTTTSSSSAVSSASSSMSTVVSTSASASTSGTTKSTTATTSASTSTSTKSSTSGAGRSFAAAGMGMGMSGVTALVGGGIAAAAAVMLW